MDMAVEQATKRTIRVVVANEPRLMRELVLETIAGQPDIEIVSEVQNRADITRVVEDVQPDFLIIELTESESCLLLYSKLLQQFPKMKILALSLDGDSKIFYGPSLHVLANGVEASEEGVLGALRSQIPQDST